MDRSTTAEQDRLAFGRFLRQARERRSLTLEQIAGETKIAPRLLTSLEQGNVQPMPKGMYRRAMLRAYAESVGLDTEAALTEFERTFEEPPPSTAALPTPPQAAAPPVASPPATFDPRIVRRALAGVALALIVGIGLWALSGDPNPSGPVDTAGAPGNAPVATPVPPSVSPGAPQPTGTQGTSEAAPAAAAASVPVKPLATEGELVVVSEPPGARVTVNGVGWGSTPVTIRYLPLGSKRVRLTLDGYLSQERTVTVDGTRPRATVRVTLPARQ